MQTKFDVTMSIKRIANVLQVEEDGQLLRATQTEQDHYEMQVRASNIVCIIVYFCVDCM